MLRQLHDQLMQAKERAREKGKLEAMRDEAERFLRDAEQKRSEQQTRMEREKADVENLEGFSLVGLFYSILGTKAERLLEERKEHLAARLKHEEAVQAVDEIRNEVERLQRELAGYQHAEAEYQRLHDEKHRLLSGAGDDRARTLLGLAEELADLHADKKELQEAIRAGETAQAALQQVLSDLHAAENWGTWDMLGGGFLATMAKHSRIDSAKQHAHAAQGHLRRFQEELADAGERLQVSLELGGFTSFADYFFDGLIVDWMVQSKIQNAASACSSATDQVSSALQTCRGKLAEVDAAIRAATERRRELTEQA